MNEYSEVNMVMKKKQVGAMKRGGEAIMKARGGKMIEAMMKRGGKVMKGKKKKVKKTKKGKKKK